jgi:hypothetical protein
MEALPIDYTTIIGSVGGFLGFLITMIVVVINMQQNSRYQNKNMEKINTYIERHESIHEVLRKDVNNIEESISKLTKLTEDADRRLWMLENKDNK